MELQGKTPQEIGSRLISTFDTLKLVAEESQERGQDQNGQSLNNFAGVIRDELTRLGYPPELFTEERVIGRLSQLTPDKIKDRARLLGVNKPTNIQETIDFLYRDIAHRTYPAETAREVVEEQRAEALTGSDYYNQFPTLETPIGNENATSLLQSYDNIVEEAVKTNQIVEEESGFVPSPQIQQRLQQITTRVQAADLPPEAKQRLLSDLSLDNGLNRTWHRAERNIILNDPDQYKVLGLEPDAFDSITDPDERKKAIRTAYNKRIRIFHPDLSRGETSDEDFWKVYRGKDTTEIAKKLNEARDTLLQTA